MRSLTPHAPLTYDLRRTPLLVAYPCEIWPYRLRSRGLTVSLGASVAANFFNTFVNLVALESIGWKYYLVFIVVLILYGLTVYFFYPETRGYSLEQIAVIFDGADSAVPTGIAMKSAVLTKKDADGKQETLHYENA